MNELNADYFVDEDCGLVSLPDSALLKDSGQMITVIFTGLYGEQGSDQITCFPVNRTTVSNASLNYAPFSGPLFKSSNISSSVRIGKLPFLWTLSVAIIMTV